MRILSLTATFGKLSRQTLTLQPGLNVIHAPNEWGKSTWCAFLVAMLYGIDTKERTTKDTLAIKERYKPWSGEEMSGRMEILWNDRHITVERSTKGRVPMGQFRAYETQSGLDIPELTAENCGQLLLGVEKSVFVRSGFLNLTDLPVTQDEALRRRLNALVTTGDDSGAADALMQKLKDLKNSCRHNKTGALPQAERQKADLENKLVLYQQLQIQSKQLTDKQEQVKQQLNLLENHLLALEYEQAQTAAARLEQAKDACAQAQSNASQLENTCAALPSEAQAKEKLRLLEQLLVQQEALEKEALPPLEEEPAVPEIFSELGGAQALQQAKSDKAAFDMLSKPLSPVLLILAIVSLVGCIGLLFVHALASLPFLVLFGVFLSAYLRGKSYQRKQKQALQARYPGLDSNSWVPLAQEYQDALDRYKQRNTVQKALVEDLTRRKEQLVQRLESLTEDADVSSVMDQCRQILDQHQALADARLTLKKAQERAEELSCLVKTVPAPRFADTLELTWEQTRQAMDAARWEAQQLQRNLGQCQGQMDALGQAEALQRQLSGVNERIDKLEALYSATELAMTTLEEATRELQRRFAPKISQRAEALLSRLTGGRYTRLQLTQDFSLQAGAEVENTLSDALWRSDGTIDQLYLSLRLAVAEALTPNAPLVLDDALVRFDETRLTLAMEILKEMSNVKQIILFTCQERETKYQ